MIGLLPTTLTVGGKQRAIRSDFRVALLIFQAYNDPELSEKERYKIMLECLFEDEIPNCDIQDALEKAIWFLDGGQPADISSNKPTAKVMDWEQDEQIIFSAVNKVAGSETRIKEYMHWWTFLGYFNEIGEGLLSTVISIRQKKAKGKKLEKHELEFYREHKDLINLKIKLTDEEQQEIDRINKLLG